MVENPRKEGEVNKIIAVLWTIMLVLVWVVLWVYAIVFWAVTSIPFLLIKSAAWAWSKQLEWENT